MVTFILLFLGYFFLTLTLSKISEKEEISSDGIGAFLLLFPPIYLLYITKRFSFMIVITAITYGISTLMINKGFSTEIALSLFFIPLLISSIYILYNLKTDLKLSLLNFFPPILGSFILFGYLAFGQTEIEIESEREFALKKAKLEKEVEKWNNAQNKKSNFNHLNKNIFKSIDNIDYHNFNNDNGFGVS